VNPVREASAAPAGPTVDPTRSAVTVPGQAPGPAGPQPAPTQPETRHLSPESAVPDGVARAEAGMPVSPPSLRDSEAGPQRAEVRRSQGGETPPLGEPASPGPSATGPGGQPALGAPSAPLMGQGLAGAPAQAASAPPAQQVAAAILGQMPSASPGAVPGASGIEGPLRLLTLQLHPADLGIVLVRMRLRDGRIEMSLHAAREETATLLREGGEVLADLLCQGGYQPERVTITSGSPSNGPVPGEGQAFQAQAEAGANPDHATPGQPDRRQPDGRAAAPETSERNHESVPSSPDRSGVYL
jgi:chemotaxis protein MotD